MHTSYYAGIQPGHNFYEAEQIICSQVFYIYYNFDLNLNLFFSLILHFLFFIL